MPRPAFLITVDTEGDDQWQPARVITTRNAAFLPRFQRLCERFGFKPVYLTNYEMVQSPNFVEFARDVLMRDAGEVGMHLHAWSSPPLHPLTRDDFGLHPYLVEYPDRLMRAKLERLTAELEECFGCKMVSHRAGRWGFDARYAAMLGELGYLVDCSVTPGLSWSANPGAPSGRGGTDYSNFPHRPYFMNAQRIAEPAADGLLEVPMTVKANALYRQVPSIYRTRVVRRFANRIAPGQTWLCPVQTTLRASLRRHLAAMLATARAVRGGGAVHLEFMIHSSELMPGGSPIFRTQPDIEMLYDYLERLFEDVYEWCDGMTLAEFYETFASGTAHATLGQDAPHPERGESMPHRGPGSAPAY